MQDMTRRPRVSFSSLVLLHRTLAAGTDAAQRRVPAEVGNVEAQRQTGLQQVVRSVDLVFFAVYMDSGHGSGFFLPVRGGRG